MESTRSNVLCRLASLPAVGAAIVIATVGALNSACGGSVASTSRSSSSTTASQSTSAGSASRSGSTPSGSASSGTTSGVNSSTSTSSVPDASVADSSTSDGGIANYDANPDALQLHASGGFTIPSGDPLNPTVAVIAADGDGLAVAGASSDPRVVGVGQFADAATVSEAFVARRAHDGTTIWSRPIGATGAPVGIAVDPSGNLVVAASLPPPTTTVTNYSYGPTFYLGKFTSSGTLIYEKAIALPGLGPNDGPSPYGVAVDGAGAIYVAGGTLSTVQGLFLFKCDAGGTVAWIKMIAGTSLGHEFSASAVTVAANDEVVMTGFFEGQADFGGGALDSEPDGAFHVPGFVARYASGGTLISVTTFGGPGFSSGSALAPLSGGDVLVSGSVAGSTDVGGAAITGDSSQGSAFVARLNRNGVGQWARLVPSAPAGTIGRAIAVDANQRAHVTGQFGGSLLVAAYDPGDGGALASISAVAADSGGGVSGYALAVDSTQSLWVGGSFDTSATIGNVTLSGTAAGVFLIRVDPGGP